MKASHRAFDRARRDVLAARAEFDRAVTETGFDRQVEREALVAGEDPGPRPPEVVEAGQRLAAAQTALSVVEKTVKVDLDAAWQRNVDAVQAAKQRYMDAIQEQGRVEKAISVAIAARPDPPPGEPWVTVEEQARLDAAAAETEAAVAGVRDAEATMKAGVTAEQLAG